MAERARSRRKGKKAKGGNGKAPRAGHNSGEVPDETYRHWLPKIELATKVYDSAAKIAKKRKSELASVFKAAGNDGCHRDAIKRARKMDRQDRVQLALELSETDRVLRLMNSPIDLFREIKRPEMESPYLRGQQAGRRGDSADTNPEIPGSEQFMDWAAGWENGQQTSRETLRDGPALPLA
jgi:ribosome modulation factor